ncbi:hypothetical protein Tco_0912252 [Tanacetum coccineum]
MNGKPHPFNGTEAVVDLVTPERKKIERYTRGLPEGVKANVTSSKPASLHDAINMARELVKQAIQGARNIISQARVLLGVVNVTSLKGYYKDKCPRGRNPQNEGARGKAYVMRTGDP